MERKFSQSIGFVSKQALFVGVLFSIVLFSAACTKSPGGSVEELIKTVPPNFNGQLTASFLSPTTTYLLTGSCDPISYAIEYSLDNQATWNTIAGGCPSGTFSITVLFTGRKKVYIRARTKTGFTATAIATIRLQLPPTSTFLSFVQSSSSDNEDGRGSQSSIEHLFTAFSESNGTVTIQSNVVETAYE